MPLHIYFEGDTLPDLPVERNAEAAFLQIDLDGCEYDKKIIKSIEEGEYLDDVNFIDRFGRILWNTNMSTGCKAALTVYHRPNSILYGIEMGWNAVLELVRNCTTGHLLLPATTFYLECGSSDETIDVVCKGRNYTSLYACTINGVFMYMLPEIAAALNVSENAIRTRRSDYPESGMQQLVDSYILGTVRMSTVITKGDNDISDTHTVSNSLVIATCALCGRKLLLTKEEAISFRHADSLCKSVEWENDG